MNLKLSLSISEEAKNNLKNKISHQQSSVNVNGVNKRNNKLFGTEPTQNISIDTQSNYYQKK